MSEAALTKIQKDCAKLEGELAVFKNSQPISTSCEAILNFSNTQPEPFCTNHKEPNPWHGGGGGGGGCTIS